eukprot:549201-Pelagomonas_calceolata.AAC.3
MLSRAWQHARKASGTTGGASLFGCPCGDGARNDSSGMGGDGCDDGGAADVDDPCGHRAPAVVGAVLAAMDCAAHVVEVYGESCCACGGWRQMWCRHPAHVVKASVNHPAQTAHTHDVPTCAWREWAGGLWLGVFRFGASDQACTTGMFVALQLDVPTGKTRHTWLRWKSMRQNRGGCVQSPPYPGRLGTAISVSQCGTPDAERVRCVKAFCLSSSNGAGPQCANLCVLGLGMWLT